MKQRKFYKVFCAACEKELALVPKGMDKLPELICINCLKGYEYAMEFAEVQEDV